MQTIDIRTSQNVTIEYELANLRERILAFLIDLLLIAVLYLLIFFVAFDLVQNANELFVNVFFGLLPVVLLISYMLLSEILADGRSWGKKALGIKVVRLDGRQAGVADYFLRAIFLLIEVVFGLGVPAAILISTSAKNQRLGDMTAHTTVVRVRNKVHFRLEDILNIESIEGYQPVFPEVKALQEADMLIIKQALSRHRSYRNEAHQIALAELAAHLKDILHLQPTSQRDEEFLKTLLRDYIVLTR